MGTTNGADSKISFAMTMPGVMLHPNLLTARPFGNKGQARAGDIPKFSANFMLAKDHPDLKGLKDAIIQAARGKWPNRKLSEIKHPLGNGDQIADKQKSRGSKYDGEFQRGHYIIAARSQYRPKLAYVQSNKIVDVAHQDDAAVKMVISKFFFGAECLAQFTFAAYNGVGANPDGVNAYLDMVLATGKGTKMAQGTTASETFSGYVGHYSDTDPTSGDDTLGDEPTF